MPVSTLKKVIASILRKKPAKKSGRGTKNRRTKRGRGIMLPGARPFTVF